MVTYGSKAKSMPSQFQLFVIEFSDLGSQSGVKYKLRDFTRKLGFGEFAASKLSTQKRGKRGSSTPIQVWSCGIRGVDEFT